MYEEFDQLCLSFGQVPKKSLRMCHGVIEPEETSCSHIVT